MFRKIVKANKYFFASINVIRIRKSSKLVEIISKQSINQNIALVNNSTGTAISYSELNKKYQLLAAFIVSTFPDKQILRIGGFTNDGILFVYSLLATWKLEKTFVPLCNTHSTDELKYIINDSGVDLLVCSSLLDLKKDFVEQVEIPIIEINSLLVNNDYNSIISKLISFIKESEAKKLNRTNTSLIDNGVTENNVIISTACSYEDNNIENCSNNKIDIENNIINNDDQNDEALIIYTSGTTGRPKGFIF
jgi:long-subunit acyl-CoA synthetase (AMP-forming)